MRENTFKIVCSQYAPEATKVYYKGHALPGDWKDIWYMARTQGRSYADMVKAIRKKMKDNTRFTGYNYHYALVTFADSGNVYARGWFTDYHTLLNVMHKTGRTLNVKFK